MRRVAIKSTPGKITVAVPGKINVFWFVVLPLVVAQMIRVAMHARNPTSLRILAAATAVLFASAWIENLFHREIVTFTPELLTHRGAHFGATTTESFEMAKIREPRFVEPRPGRAGLPTGLQFFYERVSFQVLDGISEEQAKEIIAAVARQFPELAPVWGALHGYWSGDNAGADFR